MHIEKSERGFDFLVHDSYGNEPRPIRLVSESSSIGDYADSFDRPGSSFLWVGDRMGTHHLNREEVAELIAHLQRWLDTGRLAPKADPASPTT